MTDLPRFWTHVTVGCHTREEAEAELWAFYREHPGKRRLDPQEAFEIFRTTRDRAGCWIFYLRKARA